MRAAQFLLAGHLVPVTLVALYLAPALLGLYAFRDFEAQLVAAALVGSIACYYLGFHGAAFAQRTWSKRGGPGGGLLRFSPFALQRIALVTLCVYGFLVLYLVSTSSDIALVAALRSADMTEITAAREAFVQTRTGGEAIVRYINAILFRVPVPFALVILYACRHRWRHVALAAMLLCALLSLEKTLTAFILVPLGVYFLLSGRTRALGAFVLAGVLVLGATMLGTGALSELRGHAETEHTKLLTDMWGERKNMFWVLEWLIAAKPGKPLQDVLQENASPLTVSEEGRLVPSAEEADRARSVPPDDAAQRLGEHAPREPTDVAARGPVSGAPATADEPASPRPSAAGANPTAAAPDGTARSHESTSAAGSHRATDGSEAPKPASSSIDAASAVSPPSVRDAESWRELGYRNLIANGDMRITEQPRGRAFTPPASAYVAARWLAVLSVGKLIAFESLEDAPPGFAQSLKLTVADAYEPQHGDVFELQQRIEGFKISDLDLGSSEARMMTLSFWVKASVSGIYNMALVNGRWTRSYLTRYEVLKPDEWERKVIVVPGDPAGGAEAWPVHARETLVVNFNLASGPAYLADRTDEWRNGFYRQSKAGAVPLMAHPGATLQLTGIQLEAGAAATPFEHRSLEDELALVRTSHPVVGGGLLNSLLSWAGHPDVLEDYRVQALLRRTQFIVNRIVWVPYITAYDWFRFQHEVLKDSFLRGRTIGVVARAQGLERYPIEHEVFKYQYGVFATATATANAVYFADAYVNFGWLGVVLYGLLIGAIFHVVAASRSLPLLAVSVMSVFSLMIASFPANMLSGGLALLMLLAWLFREPAPRESPT